MEIGKKERELISGLCDAEISHCKEEIKKKASNYGVYYYECKLIELTKLSNKIYKIWRIEERKRERLLLKRAKARKGSNVYKMLKLAYSKPTVTRQELIKLIGAPARRTAKGQRYNTGMPHYINYLCGYNHYDKPIFSRIKRGLYKITAFGKRIYENS